MENIYSYPKRKSKAMDNQQFEKKKTLLKRHVMYLMGSKGGALFWVAQSQQNCQYNLLCTSTH